MPSRSHPTPLAPHALALLLGVLLIARSAALVVAQVPPASGQPSTEVGGAEGSSSGERATADAPADGTQQKDPTRSSFTRRPPRPTLTDAEYARQVKELRVRYAKAQAGWPKPTLEPGVEHREVAPLPEPTFPDDNPYTKAKAELGLQLFFDPRLSGSGQIACASCHEPELGWGDGRNVSFGHARAATKRNAPSVFTAAFGKSFFWDGRAASLEEQVLGPITSDGEMRGDPAEIVRRLSGVPGYREQFEAVFGSDEVTMPRVAKAVATFQRSVARVGGNSPLDRFLRGEHDALSDAAVRGLHLFRTDARCLNCHNGPLLTDERFHDVGLSYYGRKLQDLGRYEVTKRPEDVGRFKTPTLRNVTRTAPYMHNGLFQLEGVLNMYSAGMPTLRRKPHQAGDPLFPTKSPLLKPLGLNRQDHADLMAFLDALAERRVRLRPKLPPDGDAAKR